MTTQTVSDKRLNELIDMQEYYLTHCDYEMSTRDKKDLSAEFRDMCSALKEYKSLRKIDIAYTLKYAEEAGAACEELEMQKAELIVDAERLADSATSMWIENGCGDKPEWYELHQEVMQKVNNEESMTRSNK